MAGNSQVKHGNYHNYYAFRSEDSRPTVLRHHLAAVWEGQNNADGDVIRMLDVGCNSGELTAKVHQVLQDVSGRKVRVLGVEIDSELCERARSRFPDIDFVCGNVLDIVERRKDVNNTTDPIEQRMQREGIVQFDIVSCFSVLMYIHLNGGDAGLRAVLDYLCAKAKMLILELQSWKKYRDQVRRLKRDGEDVYPAYHGLEWRGSGGKLENCIKNYVTEKGFELLGETDEKNEFNRQLLFFRKI